MTKKEYLKNNPDTDEKAIDAYIEIIGEDELDNFDEAYCGEWASDEDFVKNLLDDTGEIPNDLPAYIHIDWEWTAKEIMMDYSEENGYYFRSL